MSERKLKEFTHFCNEMMLLGYRAYIMDGFHHIEGVLPKLKVDMVAYENVLFVRDHYKDKR